jgi:PPOX class probable F420-dependent enzyme
MSDDWYPRMRTMLEAASPATLTTRRADGTPVATPVWFQWSDGAFEVVIAEDDLKEHRLEHDPRCSLLVFEMAYPFRGIEARGEAELTRGDMTEHRASIAGRYLGEERGRRFAESRRGIQGVLFRLAPTDPKVWDLADIVPS